MDVTDLPLVVVYTIGLYCPTFIKTRKIWHELLKLQYCKLHKHIFRPFNTPCSICGYITSFNISGYKKFLRKHGKSTLFIDEYIQNQTEKLVVKHRRLMSNG